MSIAGARKSLGVDSMLPDEEGCCTVITYNIENYL